MAKGLARAGVIFTVISSLLTLTSVPPASALSAVTTLASGFTWAGSKSTTLSPTSGWTVLSNISQDDRYLNIAMGFNITFEGVSYNTVQVHSNTYLGFTNLNSTSTANDTSNPSQYSGLTPNSPALPAIHMCSKDNSYQYIYYRFENSGTQLRVRYEGTASTSGTVGGSNIIYEALFSSGSSVIDIGMGVNAACDAGSGLAGVTNGADSTLEAQFPNLTYSGYTVTAGTAFKNKDYRISAGPTVSSFTTLSASRTNSSGPIVYALTLSEASTGISSSDFSNAGTATGCNFAVDLASGQNFNLTVTSCGEGTLIPQLAAGSITGTTSTGPSSNSTGRSTVIDRSAPTISSVTTTNGNYSSSLNPNLNFTMNFSESVTVTGSPRLSLTVGNSTKYANFISMSDSKTATFRFAVTVDYSAVDLDGISISSTLDLNSGAIADLATNAISTLTFTVPSTSSVNIYQPPSAPTIDSITANNTSLSVYFTPGATNGSTVTNYKYSLNGGSFSVLSPTDPTSPITISSLTNGTSYQVQIMAVSSLGDGLASNIVTEAPTASASVSIFLTASATTATKGTTITITANVNQAGVVTFMWNEKRIAGCIKKIATTSATCLWKPTVTGQWSIQAVLDPADSTYVDSYSQKLNVFILRRSGTR